MLYIEEKENKKANIKAISKFIESEFLFMGVLCIFLNVFLSLNMFHIKSKRDYRFCGVSRTRTQPLSELILR